jgi:Tol biopolymer transport system component
MRTHGRRGSRASVAATLLLLGAGLALAACGGTASTSPSAAPSQAAASPSVAASPTGIPLPPPTVTGTIAFQRYSRPGVDLTGDIYIVKTDGTGLKQLTNDPNVEGRPSWSPDGKRIVYAVYPQGSGDSRDATMWVMNADGSGKRQLTKGAVGGDWATWSPDGKQIIYMRYMAEEAFAIYAINADGSGLRRAVRPAAGSLPGAREYDLFPTWAPDGRILFLRLGQVMSVNPDGSGLVQLTKGDNIYEFTLSPDGTRIAAHYNNSDRVAVVSVHGGGGPVTLLDPVSDYVRIAVSEQANQFVDEAWTPNGKALAVASSSYYGWVGSRIYVVNADGSGLSAVPGIEHAVDPAWRPE